MSYKEITFNTCQSGFLTAFYYLELICNLKMYPLSGKLGAAEIDFRHGIR